MTHFCIHNSFHNGDVILTKAVIQSVLTNFHGVKITLECTENCAYLWRDLELPIFAYQGSEYTGIEPTSNCPEDSVFVNMWFGIFDDILNEYGMTYQNNVHTFNRQMEQYNLKQYILPMPISTPMITFLGKLEKEVEVKENSILIENGQTLSNQNYFYLNEHLKQIASDFPQLNFYCSAQPLFAASNIFDCSRLNLLELSRLGDKCMGFLMRGSAVNAATLTEINRHKPRCIVGWDLPVKLWSNEENPVIYAQNYEQVIKFLGHFIKGIKDVNIAGQFSGGTQLQTMQTNTSMDIPENDRFSHKPPLAFYQTPIGNYYLPTDVPHDIVANHMKAGAIFEQEVVDAAKKYITKGSIVLDVGANFGQMSLLFSLLTGERGQVFSFEADDYVFHILQKNIVANNCRNIRAYNKAVYDKSGNVMFYPVPDFKRFYAYGSYGLDPNATSGRNVETISLDSLNIQTPISFMKVDVQGSDLFVLRGAVETIKRHQMPIIFEYEEQFQNEFHTSFQDYLNFIELISYKVERTIYNINYLIVPDARKIFAAATPYPAQADNVQTSARLSNASMSLSLKPSLCKFLKSKSEIYVCTEYLHKKGYFSHNLVCKDWDLAHILYDLSDGNLLDMGSSDSYILKNAVLKNVQGEKYGIDLREPDVPVRGVNYIIGDLMDTKLPGEYFRNITCLSVIEHEVDIKMFASETSRLLTDGGKLYVTFDYWNPKVKPTIKLYGQLWNPLDENDTKILIEECKKKSLHLVDEVDWSLGEAVIRKGYYSPDPTMSYTFGMLVFRKNNL